jgi:ER membrane protein complex subunit 1, C-terminal
MLTGALSASRNTSSHAPVTLEVLRQSFFSKTAVRAMAPTTTLHAVTPRHLLLAMSSDQVPPSCGVPELCCTLTSQHTRSVFLARFMLLCGKL